MKHWQILCLIVCGCCVAAGQDAQNGGASPDLTRQPTLYVVPYAHLDTQWRWEYPQVIREYLPKTMRDNFALFEKYPHYVFNFSGANRYRMMREYYPADYEVLKRYVAAGRWFPSGSSMEENDVNNPSAESIMRQILYGKELFRRDFGKTSAEYMLPDCFGFPASLPSILAHMGIKGFSTQKLSWHSGARTGGADSPEQTPLGIPFNVGVWEGADGRSVIAALNATSYSGDVEGDITKSPTVKIEAGEHDAPIDWPKRVDLDGKVSGLFADFRYYGTGDTGGAPREQSVRLMEAILTRGKAPLPARPQQGQPNPPAGPPVQVGDGPLRVVQATAEQMFLDIKPEQTARMPRWKGDLELTEHSAGSLTSEAYQKIWNRRNETLADAAERASVAAEWLGGRAYPLQRLTDAWTLVMGGQFHDMIPGTATPRAFEFGWNDETIAMNQFAGVLTSATRAIASGMNTQAMGMPVIVFNPLNVAREEIVSIELKLAPTALHVFGPDGKEMPSQIDNVHDNIYASFLARVPAVSFAVFDMQTEWSGPAPAAKPVASELKVSESSLENRRYRVRLDQSGDVASIFDKQLNRELLTAPVRLAISTDRPVDWPAWNMDWADQKRAPRAYVAGRALVRVIENGPARVAVEITREAEGSKFVQTVRLAAGDAGDRVEFANSVDWKTEAANLKAVFPLAASNPQATYNWDVGTIERGNDDEKKYEVASHQWFDLTDKSGAFGVTVLSDCKNGSDKPDDSTLRLTLIRTPGIGTGNGRDYSDQTTQDWGHHEFTFGLAGHRGDWRAAQTDWQGWRLNQPLIAFTSGKHAGPLGPTFTLLRVSHPRVRVLALKKAQQGGEYIVRLVELDGKPQANVRIGFATPVAAAREVNGAEEPLGDATVQQGEIVTSFGAYQPRTFAVKLSPSAAKLTAPRSQAIAIPYDQSVATPEARPALGGFDAIGRAFPGEMLPRELEYDGVRFELAPATEGKPNALAAHGQTIELPAGNFERVYVLAASEGDQHAMLDAGSARAPFETQDWSGFIGQWDRRVWRQVEVPLPPEPAATDQSGEARRARRLLAQARRATPAMRSDYAGLQPGFVKPAGVAWYASHRHNSDGTSEPYSYSYLFVHEFPLPAGSHTLVLPQNERIRIFAVSVAGDNGDARPIMPLLDNANRVHVAAGFYGATPARQ
jgi:alpha-mannosidase